MRVRWDERTLFHYYVLAVAVLFAIYIVPVILFEFLDIGLGGVPEPLRDLGGLVFNYFFLIGVPLISLFMGASSMSVLDWRSAPEGAKELPRYLGYLMLFVTLLSIIIWIIDMSMC